MLKMIFALAIGFACGYLVGSERAREEAYQRFSNAPEPVRQVTERISSTFGGSQSSVFGGSQMSDAVKQATTRATDALHTAADGAAQASAQLPEVP
jgi:hypothetical protein